MRYLDDVYGLIDGVKNGLGKAVLPVHLIESENSLEVLEPQRVLKAPVYFQYFTQPYYRKIHSVLLQEVQDYFRGRLSQSKSD